MIPVILALVLTAQISQEKPSQGDFVILYERSDLYDAGPWIEVWSKPDVLEPPDWKFPAGQMAIVLDAPIRGYVRGSTRELVFLLIGGKMYIADTYYLVKITDINKAKKIFLDLSDALDDTGIKTTRPSPKSSLWKAACVLAAKRRKAIAQKYQISLKDLDIIERAGSTNKWKKRH